MKQEKTLYSAGFGIVLAALLLLSLLLQCESQTNKRPYQRTGNESSITGTISFVGEPPEPKKIDISADSVCARTNPNATTEDVVITDGFVANA